MSKLQIRSLIIISMSLLIAGSLAWVNCEYTMKIGNYSLYAVLGLIAFVIQWVAFIPAYKFQTEHYYDLIGSFTYLSVVVAAYVLGNGEENLRAGLITFLVIVWALRLGSFLFLRIRKDGKDTRFDEIKPVWHRFLGAWTLQGLWVFVTLAAALAVITSEHKVSLDVYAWVGLVIWIFGFAIEVVADYQKRLFKYDPKNKGRFIRTGLWAWSRHPNYFGEITLWTGIFIICIPVLRGWQWATIISPIFVFLLLTRMSGVNMLEEIADTRWGGQEDYEDYKSNTSVLFPRPPKK